MELDDGKIPDRSTDVNIALNFFTANPFRGSWQYFAGNSIFQLYNQSKHPKIFSDAVVTLHDEVIIIEERQYVYDLFYCHYQAQTLLLDFAQKSRDEEYATIGFCSTDIHDRLLTLKRKYLLCL